MTGTAYSMLSAAIATLADLVASREPAQRAKRDHAGRLLYQHYWPRFVAVYRRHRQPEAVAEELANDAMLKLLNKAHTLREPQALERWAWMIARHVLYDHCAARLAASEVEVSLNDVHWDELIEAVPDSQAGDVVTNICLEQQFLAFGAAHPDRMACIEHAVLDGASGDELAELLGRTPAATREFLSQCRKILRSYLLPCLE